MFNPQRKVKMAEIYMEERAFQLHLQKMKKIQRSNSPLGITSGEETQRKKYLELIDQSRHAEKDRKMDKVYRENHRMFMKLMEVDEKETLENEAGNMHKRHSSHYYNQKIESDRIKNDNYGIINRLLSKTSLVPTHQQMKEDYKQSKRYAKMVRKLPSISRYEEHAKQELSLQQLPKRTINSSRHRASSHNKSDRTSPGIKNIESTLLAQ